ncbi:hypothetical protein JCM9534A_13360 [Catenuloplanes indicus JCM 9534]
MPVTVAHRWVATPWPVPAGSSSATAPESEATNIAARVSTARTGSGKRGIVVMPGNAMDPRPGAHRAVVMTATMTTVMVRVRRTWEARPRNRP